MDDNSTEPGSDLPRDGPEDAVSPTTAFRLLARRPRRQLLYRLHQGDDHAVSLDALVRHLEECDPDADDAGELRVALHHVHLPKLDEAEIVDYDPDDGEVRYRGDPRMGDLLEWGIDEEAFD